MWHKWTRACFVSLSFLSSWLASLALVVNTLASFSYLTCNFFLDFNGACFVYKKVQILNVKEW